MGREGSISAVTGENQCCFLLEQVSESQDPTLWGFYKYFYSICKTSAWPLDWITNSSQSENHLYLSWVFRHQLALILVPHWDQYQFTKLAAGTHPLLSFPLSVFMHHHPDWTLKLFCLHWVLTCGSWRHRDAAWLLGNASTLVHWGWWTFF